MTCTATVGGRWKMMVQRKLKRTICILTHFQIVVQLWAGSASVVARFYLNSASYGYSVMPVWQNMISQKLSWNNLKQLPQHEAMGPLHYLGESCVSELSNISVFRKNLNRNTEQGKSLWEPVAPPTLQVYKEPRWNQNLGFVSYIRKPQLKKCNL